MLTDANQTTALEHTVKFNSENLTNVSEIIFLRTLCELFMCVYVYANETS